MKSLSDVVILDLTHMLSGPYGAMLLTDLGARTIKVEPLHGEATRQLLADSKDYSRQGMGAYFLTLNRGKQSVCVDLKSEQGREVFYDLVRHADVVFDNFSLGVTKRLKIDHETLSALNPRIITCSVTGFGETGPEPDRPAFDQVVQGLGGGMSITGLEDGPPIRSGVPIGDLGGGTFGAMGILAALYERERSGLGRHIDVAMMDVQISLLNYMATMYLMSDIIPGRLGNGHFVHVPYNTYQTNDGYIIIACIGDAFFEKFRQVLPLAELQKQEYGKQPARYANRTVIDQAIQKELLGNSTAFWLEKLKSARIPCAQVNNFKQALSDPQIVARDMVVEVTLQSGEVVPMPGNPIKSPGLPAACFSPPPLLGEHTEAVLTELLGYSTETIAHLHETGAIQ